MTTKLTVLEEPLLAFNGGFSTYCKQGLLDFGPSSASTDSHPSSIPVGIIGGKDLVFQFAKWLDSWESFIESRSPTIRRKSFRRPKAINKRLFPDFPGAPAVFHLSFITEGQLQRTITAKDDAASAGLSEIDRTVNVYRNKISELLDQASQPPKVIVLLLRDNVTRRIGNYHQRLMHRVRTDPNQTDFFTDIDQMHVSIPHDTPLTRDLRSALKCMAMSFRVPVQIVTQKVLTLDDPFAQNEATKVWNLSTGMFYKAGCVPWTLRNMEDDTCFVGVSYYHMKTATSDTVRVAVAHLFANEYECPVIKGREVAVDHEGKPVMDYKQALWLAERIGEEYERLRGVKPRRVVMHKSWEYSPDEQRAYLDFSRQNHLEFDAMLLVKSSLRVLRYSMWPVSRGSFIRQTESDAFLFTKGYVADLEVYPGVHIPAPILATRVLGETDIEQLCNELLALTKLNWNSADYCGGLPLTLGFARHVGAVLRDHKEGDQWESKYCYYM